MRKISLLFLGTALWAVSTLGYAAENHGLLETTVENWARKNLPMGSHFQKVIFDLTDLNDLKDLNITTAKNKENHTKVAFNNIHTCFDSDQVLFKIDYNGEQKVTATYSEPIPSSFSFQNHSNEVNETTFKAPELWDQFSWNLDFPLTNIKISGSLPLAKNRSTKSIVPFTPLDSRTFHGKEIKNSSGSLTLKIPGKCNFWDKATITRECMEQVFTLKVTMDIHFAVVYKNIRKKPKIDIYNLSSVFSSKQKNAVSFTRTGIFRGVYITHLNHECILKDLSSNEEKTVYTSSKGY